MDTAARATGLALTEKTLRRLALALTALALVSIFLHITALVLVGDVWDDGYMFARYARSVLEHGAIAWNGSNPTYGLTSLAQLLLDVPLALFFRNPTFVALGGSLVACALFLASIPWLVRSVIPHADALARRTCVAAAFALTALGAPYLGVLAAAGMDTMLAVAFVSLYLIVILRSFGSDLAPSRRGSIALGLLGACAYLVRPDLMLCTLLIPLALALWSGTKEARATGWLVLASTLVFLGILLAALWWYFGTPVPLPFYAKSGHLYGATIGQRFKFIPILELIAFLDSYKYAFLALAAVAIAGRRALFRRGSHAIVVGIVGFVCAYVGYFLFFVLQVMGYDGRFYFPVLPALLVLATLALFYVFKRCSNDMRAPLSAGLCMVLLASLLTPLFWGLEALGHSALRERPLIRAVWHGDILAVYEVSGGQYEWPCLDVWAGVPGAAAVATTEVGMPSAVAPDKSVVDLAGLNDTGIALQRRTLAEAVSAEQVDLVYLPTEQYYPEQRAALLNSAQLKRDYTVFAAGELGTLPDVAVRTESAYAPALIACLNAMEKANAAPAAAANEEYYHLPLPFPLLK